MDVLKRIVIVIFFCVAFLSMAKVIFLDTFPDFTSYYFGPQHVLWRENPYITDPRYFTSLVYPPTVMVFFVPLALLPYDFAAKSWIFINITSLIVSLFLLSKISKRKFLSTMNLLFCGLTFLAFPVKFSLGMGQINLLVLLLLVISLFYYTKQKNIRSGIFLGFSLMIKFFPFPLLLFFVLRKQWKLLSTIVTTCLILIITSGLILSLDVIAYYGKEILPSLLLSWKGDYYNQSLSGVIARSMNSSMYISFLRGSLSLMLVAFSLWLTIIQKKVDKKRDLLLISSFITLSVLINTFSWQHHFVFLIPSFYFLYIAIDEMKKKWIHFGILFVSYLLVAWNLPNPSVVPPFFQSHVFFGGLLLYTHIAYILIRRDRLPK